MLILYDQAYPKGAIFIHVQMLKDTNHNLNTSSPNLPNSVLGQNLLLLSTSRRLTLLRRTEEQTGTLRRLKQMTQVTPVRRVTVVLNITTPRRIRQSVPKTLSLHNALFLNSLNLSTKIQLGKLGLKQLLRSALGTPRHTDEGVCLVGHDVSDRAAGVEAGRDRATGSLDSGDGGGTGA